MSSSKGEMTWFSSPDSELPLLSDLFSFTWNSSLHSSNEIDLALLGTRISYPQQSISTRTTALPIQERDFLYLFLALNHCLLSLRSAGETV